MACSLDFQFVYSNEGIYKVPFQIQVSYFPILQLLLDDMLLQYGRSINRIAVQGGMDAGSSKIKRRREAAEAKLARSNLTTRQNCSGIGGSGVEIINVEL